MSTLGHSRSDCSIGRRSDYIRQCCRFPGWWWSRRWSCRIGDCRSGRTSRFVSNSGSANRCSGCSFRSLILDGSIRHKCKFVRRGIRALRHVFHRDRLRHHIVVVGGRAVAINQIKHVISTRRLSERDLSQPLRHCESC